MHYIYPYLKFIIEKEVILNVPLSSGKGFKQKQNINSDDSRKVHWYISLNVLLGR